MAELPESDAPETGEADEKELIALARKRFRLAAEAESDIRKEALEDLRFSAGDQWPLEVKNQRDIDNRPCLTVNRIPQFVRQITNDQRQNRPAIKVSPIDDQGTIEIAEIFQGLCRHIEVVSGADVAYDTSFDSCVRSGFGYFRIVPRYVSDETFDQELAFQRIRNPFMVYKDPNSKEPDGSDAEYYFIAEDIPRDEYEEQYGKLDSAALASFESEGDDAPQWLSADSVRIAEYFFKEYKEKTIHLTAQGNVIDDDQVEHLPEDSVIVKSRKVKVPTIRWLKINGIKILEETTWPGQWIPVFPVIGEELDIEGEVSYAGIVRYARDPQRMLNYWKSAETEAIALAPKAPFIGIEGQFKGHEAQWKAANTKNLAYLQFVPVKMPDGSFYAQPPMRQTAEPAVAAITNASMQAIQDVKDVIGIYDPSLGQNIADQSGIAIKRLNQQAQTTNFHLVDNLHRSIRHAGRVLVDAIPYYYDTKRAVRIIGDDGEASIQVINSIFQDGENLKSSKLDAGRYDVAVDSGPSYQTKREEAVSTLLDLTRNVPSVNQAAPDLVVRSMDIPHAQEIADRLKLMLPPALQQDQKNQPLPPAAVAQMQQQGNMIQQLSQQLHAAMDVIEQKQMELASRERIEMAKIQAQLEMKLADLHSNKADTLLAAQIGAIQHREELLHSAASIDQEAQYDAQKLAQQHLQQQRMAQAGQQQSAQNNSSQQQPGNVPPQAAPPTGGQSPG